MEDFGWAGVAGWLGIGDGALASGEMALRAAVVYLAAIVLVSAGARRFMGRTTAFDTVLAIILGSVLSRAVTGNSPFVPTIAAGAVLVALHWAFAVLSFRWHRFGRFVKGREHVLVRDGVVDWAAMRRSHLSRGDLESALHARGISGAGQVEIARLERSGKISVIERAGAREPRVVEIAVVDGVQRVRVELG